MANRAILWLRLGEKYKIPFDTNTIQYKKKCIDANKVKIYYKVQIHHNTKYKGDRNGFRRNPAILWLRRGKAGGGNMRQITQEKRGKLPKT